MRKETLGILVHGSNHFIVRGPLPSKARARALAKEWEFVSEIRPVGWTPPPSLWTISSKEFREDLQWAVELEGEQPVQAPVRQLLSELAGRGIAVHRANGPFLPADGLPEWQGETG